MELRLAHGSFRLSIATLDKTFVQATSHEPIHLKTCADLIRVTETTPSWRAPAPAPTTGPRQLPGHHGRAVREVGGRGRPDGGVDLVLSRDGETTVVQAKHWRRDRVGVRLVREV